MDLRKVRNQPTTVDLGALATGESTGGAAWAFAGEELNANLIVFEAGEGVEAHVNAEVEVLLVGIEGEGRVTVDDREWPLRSGGLLVIPKGARRAIRSAGGRFAYLTCHRRRPGLWPSNVERNDGGSDELPKTDRHDLKPEVQGGSYGSQTGSSRM